MNNLLSGLTQREIEIFDRIQKNGPVTKNDLIQNLNFKLTTLNRSMELLKSKKLIVESGISVSTGGRKPSEYDVTQGGFYCLGVDISRTYVQVVVINLKMQVLEKYRFDMDSSITPQICVARIADAIEQMLSKMLIDRKRILGLGVGTVGPINRENGMLLHPQGFSSSAWNDDIPLKDLLQAKTGIPCEIDNGANTAVLAEFIFGTGRGHSCVAYIHCGVGIRTAVIRDGMIFRTINDSEDAFAHMTVDFNGSKCRCGGKGCLESYVSLESIGNHYAIQSGNKVPYKELLSLAAGHEKALTEVLDYSAKMLGIGISNLAKLLNPDLVILSGPLVLSYEPYFSACVNSFHEWNSFNSKLVFSREGTFKESVIAIGAGLMVIEHNFKRAGGNG